MVEVTSSQCLTSVCPVVVLHGWQVEEGVVAGRPGALIWFLSTVQFHVVVQGPFFTEGALTQVAFKLPAGGEERQRGIRGRRRRRRREKRRVIYWSQSWRKMLDNLPCEKGNGGCWVLALTPTEHRAIWLRAVHLHQHWHKHTQHTQNAVGCWCVMSV